MNKQYVPTLGAQIPPEDEENVVPIAQPLTELEDSQARELTATLQGANMHGYNLVLRLFELAVPSDKVYERARSEILGIGNEQGRAMAYLFEAGPLGAREIFELRERVKAANMAGYKSALRVLRMSVPSKRQFDRGRTQILTIANEQNALLFRIVQDSLFPENAPNGAKEHYDQDGSRADPGV